MISYTRLTNAIDSGNYRAIQAECRRLRDNEGAAVWWSLTAGKTDMIRYALELIEEAELAQEYEAVATPERPVEPVVEAPRAMSYRDLQKALKRLRTDHPEHPAMDGLKLNAKKVVLQKAYDDFYASDVKEAQEMRDATDEAIDEVAAQFISDYHEPIVEVNPPDVAATQRALIDQHHQTVASYVTLCGITGEYTDWAKVEANAKARGEVAQYREAYELLAR